MSVEIKQAVTVSEMARMVRAVAEPGSTSSSARPSHIPLYSVSTRRPFFDEELQKVCLEVRRKNCGIDGKPILFYSRRLDLPAPKKQIRYHTGPLRPGSPLPSSTSLIVGLAGLGLSGRYRSADRSGVGATVSPMGLAVWTKPPSCGACSST